MVFEPVAFQLVVSLKSFIYDGHCCKTAVIPCYGIMELIIIVIRTLLQCRNITQPLHLTYFSMYNELVVLGAVLARL